ncbi:MAG: hypothetical protein DLM57_11635 [Pseudonocardiales bacterium]|nr:MAG: hypothetical protein DLM57_11635 [Pseudonocardiales bacterium]
MAGPAAAAPQAPPPPYASAVRGLAPQVHRVAASAPSHAVSPRSKGARQRPVTASRLTSSAARVAGAASAATGTLLHNFNGVSSRDSEITNFNQRFEPPDQGLCAGNGFVLEPVNSAYSIYTPSGKVVRGPFNVNDLFDEGAAEFTSDPRCYFDTATNTWFATILFLNASFTAGRIDIAVSTTSDPTGLWRQFQIDTTHLGGNGCPCFGDQPRMGIDHQNIYVSTDEFSINGPEFNGAQLYAIAKNDLVTGASTAHFVHFANLSIGGTLAGAVEPAITTGSPAAEYFLSSLDPNGTFDNRLGVWALSHGDRVATGGMPVLSQQVITSEPYGRPPPATQRGSASTIDSGDDRMQQAQFIKGRIWGELTTGLTIPGDPAQRAGAAWFAVRPILDSSGRLTDASISRQGYVSMSGRYALYPALQADASGRAAMVFTLTGKDLYPSAAYATLPATGTAFGPISIAAVGTGPYDKNATRWGDYSFAILDPVADAVWMATEYIPRVVSQTSTRARNWGTRVFEVGLS